MGEWREQTSSVKTVSEGQGLKEKPVWGKSFYETGISREVMPGNKLERLLRFLEAELRRVYLF